MSSPYKNFVQYVVSYSSLCIFNKSNEDRKDVLPGAKLYLANMKYLTARTQVREKLQDLICKTWALPVSGKFWNSSVCVHAHTHTDGQLKQAPIRNQFIRALHFLLSDLIPDWSSVSSHFLQSYRIKMGSQASLSVADAAGFLPVITWQKSMMWLLPFALDSERALLVWDGAAMWIPGTMRSCLSYR